MVDVWSAGVMLYVMLFCRYPFERPEDQYDSRRFQKVGRLMLSLLAYLCWKVLLVSFHFVPEAKGLIQGADTKYPCISSQHV